MDIRLTEEEQTLVEYSKVAVVKYNKIRHINGGIDTLYSFLVSESGNIYDGAAFEPSIVCAERHAIANLTLQESYKAKIKSIVIAAPVPELQTMGTPPCGACRETIWNHGTSETIIILMQYIQSKTNWTFPKIEKYTIKDFYPLPYEEKEDLWDNWAPK
jgi:cytidine deaminase